MKSINDINWQQLKEQQLTPSPQSWAEQVFYFVMTDRFSDGQEIGYVDKHGSQVTSGTTPPYTEDKFENAIKTETAAASWRAAGNTFVGGTLRGLESKLGYLQRLGITTIWLSPVLKQAAHDKTAYHGYNTQDFLNVDPHYGTREDLKKMVATAHSLGIYVVLDIIFNHAGYVFRYAEPYLDPPEGEPQFNYQGKYSVKGFCDAVGQPTIPFDQVDLAQHPDAWPDGAIWPQELQSQELFNCRGCISDWNHPDNYLNGDFMYCKDFNLGMLEHDHFQPSTALTTLIDVYKYWLAYADLDGFRIDAVKHVPEEATQLFIGEIDSFAKNLGKHNFLTIGEIAGGISNARKVLAKTDLKAFLGIDDVPAALVKMVRGQIDPANYFNYFHNDFASNDLDDWSPQRMITIYDDHDQIRLGYDKARFPSGCEDNTKLAMNAVFTLLTTQGIPCLYYGSEQGFDGAGRDDNYIREAMFGGDFGAFRSQGAHFFNEQHASYQFIKELLAFRSKQATLIQGDQRLLEISGDGENFGLPAMIGGQLRGIIPWMRKYHDDWLVCIINTDAYQATTAWVKIGRTLDQEGRPTYLFSNDARQVGQSVELNQQSVGAVMQVQVPAAGCVIIGTNSNVDRDN